MVKKINSEEYREVIKEGYSLVDFYADWCGPCQMLAPIVEEVSNEISSVSFYKLNTDENTQVAIENNISSIPALGLFKDGERIDLSIGLISKEKLIDFISRS